MPQDTTFRTRFIPQPAEMQIDIERPMLFIGSCFAERMGGRMCACGADALINPCGVLFNPASICSALTRTGNDELRLFEAGGLWRSWDFPAAFAAPDKQQAETLCRQADALCHRRILSAATIVITLGTAIVYELTADALPVANCHKQPAALFRRRRLSTAETTYILCQTIAAIQNLNPDIKTILTVSPVRHVKEGFEDNARSKATLLLAGEEVCRTMPHTAYFPAYEIFIDDLRDYRFCAADMLHPSDTAAAYITDIFEQTFVDATGRAILHEAEEIRARMNHRPLRPDSEAAKAFAAKTHALIHDFTTRHPSFHLKKTE